MGLFDFFLHTKSDLTGDGKIDSKDVISFWENMSKDDKGSASKSNEGKVLQGAAK